MARRTLLAAGAVLALAAPAAGQAPAVTAVSSSTSGTTWKPTYTIDQFLSPASPLEVSAAKKADRIAWVTYERGMRNIYVASAPLFRPVRITKFLADDGVDVGSVRLSDDGTMAIFVRGSAQNREGWVANPSHDPDGGERAVWAARTDGSGAWRLAAITGTQVGFRGGPPELSPDGKYVVYVKDGQIYRVSTARGPKTPMDSGAAPFIRAWGSQSSPQWSPDGSRLAFVSTRENHAFIGVYHMTSRRVEFLSPSTDIDGSPTWSPDGKRIAFIRRPGTPFGQQTVADGARFGQTPTPGAARNGGAAPAATGCPVRPAGNAFRGGFGAQDTTPPIPADGLCRAAFAGGYTIAFMVADVATGQAREFWHSQPLDRTFGNMNAITWAGDHVVFTAQVPKDEWDRHFSVSIVNPQPAPVLLTTTDGLINDGVADRTFTTTGRHAMHG